jgi:precorrin-6B methylase 1
LSVVASEIGRVKKDAVHPSKKQGLPLVPYQLSAVKPGISSFSMLHGRTGMAWKC